MTPPDGLGSTEEYEPAPDAEPKWRFRLTHFDKVTLSTTAAYLVKGLIPREGLIVVWGAPKCGKSFWVFDLTMHVALGWEYRGHRVAAGTIVYVACEGERGLAARIEAFRVAKMGDTSGAPAFYLLTTRLGLATDAQALIADIRAQLGDEQPAAIVIDTLNRSIEGSESDDRDMGDYVKAADAIREAFGAAVIVIHHCGIEGSRPRGHTSLTGAADAQIAVKRDAAGQIVATVEYMKDGPEGAQIVSRLEVIELGPDEDGEPITSCVVEPADEAAPSRGGPRPKATGPAKVALDLLRRAIDDAGEPAPASNHVPAHVRVVDLDLWRRYAYDGSVADSDQADAKRRAFGRAVAKLQSLDLARVWGKVAWIVPE